MNGNIEVKGDQVRGDQRQRSESNEEEEEQEGEPLSLMRFGLLW